MKALKTLFLTVAIAVGLANSTKAQNTYTLGLWGANDVSNAAVSGTSNVPMDSLVVNVGDVITFVNAITQNTGQAFTINVANFGGIAPGVSFTYTVLSTDVPDILVSGSITGSIVDNVHVKIKVNAPSTTGISKNIEKVEFKAFPNPIVNELNIQSTGKLGIVVVTNMVGQVVFEKSFEDDNTKIDFSNFDAGVYVVCAGNTKQKFIKQ
jgi:hypothetical protein